MEIKAPIKIDKKTKVLAKRLQQGDVAVINHVDIDEISATSLANAKIKLVINASKSISGKYPNKGPSILTRNNINIIDNVGEELFKGLTEGDLIEISKNEIYKDGRRLGIGEFLDNADVESKIRKASENVSAELDNFIENTMEYVSKEKDFILNSIKIPKMSTNYKDKKVLIVIRGQNYKEDLKALIPYIKREKPVLVGVDGGADALLEIGYISDVIVGDMDSVSDEALKLAKEIVIHAYQDGRAPGLKRIESLNLKGITVPAPGTSEDIAMLIAHENKAEQIVAVGTHSNMVDFLEKGRSGMSSTFLTRLKLGSKLIDAKGANALYKNNKTREKAYLFTIGLLSMVVLFGTIIPAFNN